MCFVLQCIYAIYQAGQELIVYYVSRNHKLNYIISGDV
jgi:hypothetical protein